MIRLRGLEGELSGEHCKDNFLSHLLLKVLNEWILANKKETKEGMKFLNNCQLRNMEKWINPKLNHQPHKATNLSWNYPSRKTLYIIGKP